MGRRYSTLRDSTASSVKPARRPCAGKPERPRFFEVSTRIRAIGVIAPEGEVLDMLVQSRRDSRAALRLMRKLLKKQVPTDAAGHSMIFSTMPSAKSSFS